MDEHPLRKVGEMGFRNYGIHESEAVNLELDFDGKTTIIIMDFPH
jgi:hypothetical protein